MSLAISSIHLDKNGEPLIQDFQPGLDICFNGYNLRNVASATVVQPGGQILCASRGVSQLCGLHPHSMEVSSSNL